MENSKLTRVIARVLSVLMLTGLVTSVAAAPLLGSSSAKTDESVTNEALEILGDDKWNEYREKYGSYPFYAGEPIQSTVDTATLPAGAEVKAQFEGKTNVVYLPDEGAATWTVTVPETALYAIEIPYYAVQSKATDVERTLRIDGEVPFTEVRNLRMTYTKGVRL